MEKLQILSKYLMALALIYFSTVLLLFVNEVAKTRKAVPAIIEKLDSIENSDNIQEVLRLASKITGDTARVSDEIAAIRKELPQLYSEAEKTRKVIPAILNEVEAVRSELPAFYAEVGKTRDIIPEILEEMQALREELPKLLADTSALIKKAKKVSDEAGKGAVHGVIKGIITTPINVIESGISGVKENVTGKEKSQKKR